MPEKPKRNKTINVRGAKLHNLKDISVEIPRNKITVITGVSGSGKSTLAFDTIYAEGKRRFVQSLSSYARQFLERMNRPDCDSIDGLPPAIAIEQRKPSRNPRSTVGTNTEIYDHLRLLFGRIGTTYCRKCGKPVRKDNPSSVVEELMKLNDGEKIYVMFPISPQAKSIKKEMQKLSEKGFFRIYAKDSDEIIDIERGEVPKGTFIDDIYVLADRLAIKKDNDTAGRLGESVESAMINGLGRMVVRVLSQKQNIKFSSNYECADCEIIYYEPEPRLFSFNDPYGACPNCQGFGRTIGIDMDLVIPDKSRSLKKGAIHPFRTQGGEKYLRALMKIAPKYNIPEDEPYRNLNEEQQEIVLNGAGNYIGINGFFNMLEEKNYKVQYRVLLSRYRGYTRCNACGGSRLRTSARQVFVGGKNIPELIKIPLDEVLDYIQNLKISKYQASIVSQVLREIEWRLQLLVDIGLEYLTLERLSHTLSGGEAQRINLSTALGSSLVGTLYVLDEPSIGMHPRDTKRLMDVLFKLRNLGNTVIIVEHDTDIIKQADLILDLGPKAGEFGGELVYSGTPEKITESDKSLTGLYLSGKKKIELNGKRKKCKDSIILYKPRLHNLKMDSVEFPLECMICVTGVSGSGKSTLVHDILYSALKKFRGGTNSGLSVYDKITGAESIEQVELVDQSPIGKSRRSTPATYTKIFDFIRELFSQTQGARQLGWKPGHFSFNVPGGRCDICDGEGAINVDMQFLPDVQIECESCKGTRYRKEVRNIHYKGKSIVDVLNMTVDEALEFFEGNIKIARKLKILQEVGLGYLRLGQPSTQLSGGESQRIKLSGHLESQRAKKTMFIFDEPTTGLHLDDISKLISCFRKLVERGHSVLIIEHNLHVIASSDWIIDLGPEAGGLGGELVAEGPPEKIAKLKKTHTGMALKSFLGENGFRT